MIRDLNVVGFTPLPSPDALLAALPAPPDTARAVAQHRHEIQNVLRGVDPRLLVVVGPCSIHDVDAALEYAKRLAELRDRVQDKLLLVMRVYFEKPRTTVGWKGLINDPHLDGTFDMAEGLRRARRLLLDIAGLGLPAGTELLEPITPQYLDDLIAWSAIGARTTESQTHRQMASGLSMPVGFKNSTDGNLQVALDAMQAARRPHHFLGIDHAGQTCVVQTRGNAFGHLILRGGGDTPNYHPDHIADAAERLAQAELAPVLMVDCSHANSGKKHQRQADVWSSLVDQRVKAGKASSIIGAMIESHLHEGNQSLSCEPLHYGVSITDACVSFEQTQAMLLDAWQRL